MEIARFSGANIVGINSNTHQIERARTLTAEAGLSHLAEYVHGDFMDVDAPDNAFDAVYAIEATCYAPDKRSIYSEVLRLLKPGAPFAAYEWCLTDRFDANNRHHLKIKADIEFGSGLLDIDHTRSLMTRFERWDSRHWRHEICPNSRARPFPSTNRWSVQAYPWPTFAVHGSDAGLPTTRCEGSRGSTLCRRNGSRVRELEPRRRCAGRGGPTRHLHANVLSPRPQAGVARSRLDPLIAHPEARSRNTRGMKPGKTPPGRSPCAVMPRRRSNRSARSSILSRRWSREAVVGPCAGVTALAVERLVRSGDRPSAEARRHRLDRLTDHAILTEVTADRPPD